MDDGLTFEQAQSHSFHHSFSLKKWIPIFWFGAICFVVLFATLCTVIYQFKTSESIKKVTASVKWCSILSLICFLSALIWNIFYIVCNKMPGSNVTKFSENMWGIYNSFWSFGYFFTYLLFYMRLRQTFQATVHRLSKTVSIVFFTLLSIYIISQQVISLVWFLLVLEELDWAQFNAIYHVTLWIKFITDTILNGFIVYLFCSKIFAMTIDKNRVTMSCPSVFKNVHSPAIFNTMIKYFLLTFLTCLSTKLFSASEITLSVAIDHALATDQFEFYYTAYIFHFLLACTDSMVSTMYIILTFPFAKCWYNKYCKCCHSLCLKIWGKCALSQKPSNRQRKLKMPMETQMKMQKRGESDSCQKSTTNIDNDMEETQEVAEV